MLIICFGEATFIFIVLISSWPCSLPVAYFCAEMVVDLTDQWSAPPEALVLPVSDSTCREGQKGRLGCIKSTENTLQ